MAARAPLTCRSALKVCSDAFDVEFTQNLLTRGSVCRLVIHLVYALVIGRSEDVAVGVSDDVRVG